MSYFCLPLCLGLLITFAAPATGKIRKESIEWQGGKRTYYLFVPDSVTTARPAPLLLLLHGSRRDGLSLVEPWKDLAEKEGIILVGPNAKNSIGWGVPDDGPQFLHHLISQLKERHPIDMQRLYLFGHSAGAVFALYMSFYESEYFAAASVHAGALPPRSYRIIELAERKIPISIFVGTEDPFFPVTAVRETRDVLNKRGFDVQLTEIWGHDHGYYERASKINREVWAFLSRHELTDAPRYKEYRFGNRE